MKNNNQNKKYDINKVLTIFIVIVMSFIVISSICLVYIACVVSDYNHTISVESSMSSTQCNGVGSLSDVALASDCDNRILNFNQLIPNGAVSPRCVNDICVSGDSVYSVKYSGDSVSWWEPLSFSSISLISSHHYYVSANIPLDITSFFVYCHFDGVQHFVDCSHGSIFTNESVVSKFNLRCNSAVDSSFSPILIDLTQMFGVGNEPSTLDELYTYIPKGSYFPYNVGTPIAFNGLSSYQQGVNDTIDAFSPSFDLNYLSKQSYNQQVVGFISGDAYWSSEHNRLNYEITLPSTPQTGDYGFLAIPLGMNLPLNTQVKATMGGYVLVSKGSSFVKVPFTAQCYNYAGQGVPTANIDVPFESFNNICQFYCDDSSSTCTFYTTSDKIDTFYFSFSVPDTGDYDTFHIRIDKFELSFINLDNRVLLDNAYKEGISIGKGQGYQNGYTAGYNEGVKGKDYTFTSLINGVIQAPITALIGSYDSNTGTRVGGLLNFEFLGYNMSTLLMSLFSITLVICIIRLFL